MGECAGLSSPPAPQVFSSPPSLLLTPQRSLCYPTTAFPLSNPLQPPAPRRAYQQVSHVLSLLFSVPLSVSVAFSFTHCTSNECYLAISMCPSIDLLLALSPTKLDCLFSELYFLSHTLSYPPLSLSNSPLFFFLFISLSLYLSLQHPSVSLSLFLHLHDSIPPRVMCSGWSPRPCDHPGHVTAQAMMTGGSGAEGGGRDRRMEEDGGDRKSVV